jgi:hypothetical protein
MSADSLLYMADEPWLDPKLAKVFFFARISCPVERLDNRAFDESAFDERLFNKRATCCRNDFPQAVPARVAVMIPRQDQCPSRNAMRIGIYR